MVEITHQSLQCRAGTKVAKQHPKLRQQREQIFEGLHEFLSIFLCTTLHTLNTHLSVCVKFVLSVECVMIDYVCSSKKEVGISEKATFILALSPTIDIIFN